MEYIAGSGEVPLHNVYSALGKSISSWEYAFGPSVDPDFFAGWLISVTDPLPPSSPLVHYQDMLERYARLCWTLSSRIGAYTMSNDGAPPSRCFLFFHQLEISRRLSYSQWRFLRNGRPTRCDRDVPMQHPASGDNRDGRRWHHERHREGA